MRLNVVHDRDGQILAAAIVPEDDDVPLLRPVANDDQDAAELEVPQEHDDLDLEALCTRFRVDTTSDSARLVPREDQSAS